MPALRTCRLLFLVFSTSFCMLSLLIPSCSTAMPDLSVRGVKAYQVVKKAESFYNSAVGYAGSTPAVVWAFRDLLAEKNADAAFKSLLQEATLPGRLYGLCGLWFTDQAAFKEQVAHYRAMPGKVKTMIGCIIAEDEIAELVESKHPNAIRLRGPEDTMQAWWARNPKAQGFSDIAGGCWPSELKGKKGAQRPVKR
ncbi:MAG: hypothetical protein B7Z37_16275 [Verrucomicrobia bacterium 12-59-8]|nr:MAG: hypothetical protein B7Z37_16275 [Verrucomicrobia bacterium 12-59-8]